MKAIELLQRIAASLETRSAPELWGVDQIAAWLKMSAPTVQERVVTRPDFPKPHVPTGERFGQKRWFADEVIEYARENRAKLPAPRSKRSAPVTRAAAAH